MAARVPTTAANVLANMPAAARHRTAGGAKAFARYYFEVYNEICQRPTTGILPKLGYKGCESCAVYEKHNREYIRENVRFPVDPVLFTRVYTSSPLTSPRPGYQVVMKLIEQKTNLVEPDGTVYEKIDRANLHFVADVVWANGWRMAEVWQFD